MQAASPATPDQDDAYYREILHTLIAQGADLARRIHESASAPPSDTQPATPTPNPTTDLTIAFDRIARAIRRTIALARHIAANAPAPRKNNRDQARTRLIRGVEDAIHRRRHDTDAEALAAEFNERLEDPALEFDLAGRPTDDVIEEICRDLGINTQGRYRRRDPGAIADLRAKAAATPIHPGKPGPHTPNPAITHPRL